MPRSGNYILDVETPVAHDSIRQADAPFANDNSDGFFLLSLTESIRRRFGYIVETELQTDPRSLACELLEDVLTDANIAGLQWPLLMPNEYRNL